MSNLTYNEYWAEVGNIATELAAEAMESTENDREAAEDEINDYRLHEWIDGHQWVIYYAYNDGVLEHSDNEDYYEDNFGAEDMAETIKSRGLSGLKTVMAYFAMYADVQDKISSALDELEAVSV